MTHDELREVTVRTLERARQSYARALTMPGLTPLALRGAANAVTQTERLLSDLDAQERPCPTCRAPRHSPCTTASGKRRNAHKARM